MPRFDPQRDIFDNMYRSSEEPYRYSMRGVEQVRHEWIVDALRHLRLGKVLEVGCSQGLFTRRLSEISDDVTAVDLSTLAVDRAQRTMGRDVRWAVGSALGLPFRSAAFDTVLAIDGPLSWYLTLEERAQTYREIAHVSKKDGSIVISEYVRPAQFQSFVSEIASAGLDIHSVDYLHDRIWYKLEKLVRPWRTSRVAQKAVGSASMARRICSVSRLVGRSAAHHIMVVARPE